MGWLRFLPKEAGVGKSSFKKSNHFKKPWAFCSRLFCLRGESREIMGPNEGFADF